MNVLNICMANCDRVGIFNPYTVGGMYMSHLDDGHNSRLDVFVPVKQFCIDVVALSSQFSVVRRLISWALPFSNTVNTLVKIEDS